MFSRSSKGSNPANNHLEFQGRSGSTMTITKMICKQLFGDLEIESEFDAHEVNRSHSVTYNASFMGLVGIQQQVNRRSDEQIRHGSRNLLKTRKVLSESQELKLSLAN